MKLKALNLRSLPGLEPGFEIDFEPDSVNVITGPNASGKSSIVRAVRALLYPDQQPEFCDLRAEWLRDGQTWVSERRGHHVDWQADGHAIEAPALPPNEAAGAFLISAEDLNALGQTDEHIASHLRTMLAGGYDLDAARQQGVIAPRSKPKKLAQELGRLQQAVLAKETEYVELNDELGTLDRLRRQLASTQDAAGRLRAIDDALAMADAIAERNAIEKTLIEEYPGGMDRLRGDELERLDQAEDKLAQRYKELTLAESALAGARDALGDGGSVDPTRLEALQAELGDFRDQLTDLEQRIEQQHDQIGQQEQTLDIAARRLGKSKNKKKAKVLDQPKLEEMEKRVDRVHALREQIRNLTAELARTHVSSNMTGRSQEDLRTARKALVQWMDAARTSPLEGVLWGGLSVASAVAAWRLLGPQALEPLPELVMLILIAIGVPLSLVVNFGLRWRDLDQAVKFFLATDIEPPLGWTEGEVEARLERLDLELESATKHEISQARSADVRQQLNTQRSSLDQARSTLNELASKLGISAENRLETGFQLWCRHLHDWQQEESGLARSRTQLEQLQSRYKTLQADIIKRLQSHGLAQKKAPDAKALAGIIHRLTPRMRRNAELHNELIAHERRIKELKADIEQLQSARDPIFTQAGLKAGDRDGLVSRADQYSTWRALEQARRDQATEISRLESRLAEEADLIQQARDQAREQLEGSQAALADKVAERDQINRRIGEIQTRHQDLLERRELEQLTSERARAEQSLSQELDAHLLSEAASLLIDDVQVAHQSSNEPAALTQAGRWFERFTRHRYRLNFHNDHFTALDTRDGIERAVSELSTGTRVQLLLAVRLAWIERLEDRAEPTPVFMDEVLTTTDPDRYRSIVGSVQELVNDGRQMFYLTAQSDDAQAWSEWSGDGPTPNLIDMASVRSGQIDQLEFQMPAVDRPPADLPDPGDMALDEWAKAAGVDAVSPWRDAGALHVFHVLQDRPDQVAELIRYELARVGELESFLNSAQASKLISTEERDRLECRMAAARLLLDDWRLRHDRPVDDQALVRSSAISDHFMGRVQALNEELGGQPEALIDGLRNGKVSRFRSDNIDQLEAWLLDQGFLNTRQARDPLGSARISVKSGLPPDEVTQLRDWIVGAIKDPMAV
ncbi:MAG: AAA family ATPase [Pseudomonadota bacterium]